MVTATQSVPIEGHMRPIYSMAEPTPEQAAYDHVMGQADREMFGQNF